MGISMHQLRLGWWHQQMDRWLWRVTALRTLLFLVNINGVGYYRVTYDENNWLRLAETLRTDFTLIPPLNRAQIICDILSLERSGRVSKELREEVLSYLGEEDDFAPILAFERCSAYVKGDFTDKEAAL